MYVQELSMWMKLRLPAGAGLLFLPRPKDPVKFWFWTCGGMLVVLLASSGRCFLHECCFCRVDEGPGCFMPLILLDDGEEVLGILESSGLPTRDRISDD